jgi:hypothetical protein
MRGGSWRVPRVQADATASGCTSVRWWLCVVALAVAISSITAACGSASNAKATRSMTGSARTATHRTDPAGTSYGLAALALMFPRDGQDLAAGAALEDFEIGVGLKSETECLGAADLPGPPSRPLPELQYGTTMLPNIPLIRRTLSLGLTVAVARPSDPAAKLPVAERKAYAAVLARCVATARWHFRVLGTPTANSLVNEWMNILDQTEASHTVQVLSAKAAVCSSKTRFAASSIPGEMQRIADKLPGLLEAGDTTDANATQAAGARVLVNCFGPEVLAVTKLLMVRRAQFFSENAQAIEALQKGTDQAVDNLDKAGATPATGGSAS